MKYFQLYQAFVLIDYYKYLTRELYSWILWVSFEYFEVNRSKYLTLWLDQRKSRIECFYSKDYSSTAWCRADRLMGISWSFDSSCEAIFTVFGFVFYKLILLDHLSRDFHEIRALKSQNFRISHHLLRQFLQICIESGGNRFYHKLQSVCLLIKFRLSKLRHQTPRWSTSHRLSDKGYN